MVNRVLPPSLSQGRRDATTQQLQQMQQMQQIQQAPARNRLLDLQAQQIEQNIELAPQRLDLAKSQESRLQSTSDAEAKNRQLAVYLQSMPILNPMLKGIRALPEDQRAQAMTGLKSFADKLQISEGVDFNNTSNAGLDQAIEFTDSIINTLKASKSAGRDTRTKSQKNFQELQEIRAREARGELPEGSAEAFAIEEGLLTSAEQAEHQRTVTAAKKGEELKQKRISGIREELGERSRSAIRSSATVREALQAASNADQGISGALKLQLGRLFPGIDTSDEAALDSALKDLAVQQLQNFKGPTTDFEFVQVQNITGRLSDGRSANEARLAALDRAQWFMQQELAQFDRYISTGGDPDKWEGFNYDEDIQTSAGPITMRDLRDTAAANHITIEETLRRLNQ